MTKRTRRNHSGSFKAKMALPALQGEKTLIEIAEQFEVHPTQVTEAWFKNGQFWATQAHRILPAHGHDLLGDARAC